MTERKARKKAGSAKRPREYKEQAFNTALKNIEAIAFDRIRNARNPFAVGMKMAQEFRKLADKLEIEAGGEVVSMTEASLSASTMVGIGVGP